MRKRTLLLECDVGNAGSTAGGVTLDEKRHAFSSIECTLCWPALLRREKGGGGRDGFQRIESNQHLLYSLRS